MKLKKTLVLTHKDSSIILLIHLSELALRSALGDIEHRSKFSTKWREVHSILQPQLLIIEELIESLQEKWLSSPSLKENDMVRDMTLIQNIVSILINIGHPEVDKAVRDITIIIDKIKNERRK